MDLWIRTQEKNSLMKIDNINLGYQNDENNKTLNEPRRLFTFKNNTSFCLGVYKTKERALEVLDEIQKLLLPKVKVNTYEIERCDMNMMYFVEHAISDFSISQSSTYVYEMPEE